MEGTRLERMQEALLPKMQESGLQDSNCCTGCLKKLRERDASVAFENTSFFLVSFLFLRLVLSAGIQRSKLGVLSIFIVEYSIAQI
jgi:hypothetical protein